MIAIVKPIELDADTLHLHLPVAVAATAVFCAVLGLRHRLGRVKGAFLLALYVLYIGAAVTVGL